MRSSTPRALMLPLIPLFAVLALPGCVGVHPTLAATPSACSTLLPDEWQNGVPSADLDNGGASVGDWIKFGDAQTGQLDKANDRYVAGVGIIKRCEDRDKAAIDKATRRRFLGIF